MDALSLRRVWPRMIVAALALAGCDDEGAGGTFGPAIASGTSGGRTSDGDGDSLPSPDPGDESDGGTAPTTGEPGMGDSGTSMAEQTSSSSGDTTSTAGDADTGGESSDGSTGEEPPPPPVDPCAGVMFGDGPYCGESIGGTPETLYVCTAASPRGRSRATSAAPSAIRSSPTSAWSSSAKPTPKRAVDDR